eukprot:jgi/Chrpa1/14497/Chrysochromulina_OHIO_Genome00002698-RA
MGTSAETPTHSGVLAGARCWLGGSLSAHTHSGGAGRGLRHLDDERLDVLAVGGGARKGQPQLERLPLARDGHVEAEPIERHQVRLLHLIEAYVVLYHGDRRSGVVVVHVRHDWRGEGLDRIHLWGKGEGRRDEHLHARQVIRGLGRIYLRRLVVRGADVSRTGEAADEAHRLELAHAEPQEVAEVDPEGVGVLLFVDLAQLGNLRLVLDALDVADESVVWADMVEKQNTGMPFSSGAKPATDPPVLLLLLCLGCLEEDRRAWTRKHRQAQHRHKRDYHRNPVEKSGTLELNVHDTTKLLLDDLDATRSLRYDADTCKIRFPDLTLSLKEAINFFNKIETTASAARHPGPGMYRGGRIDVQSLTASSDGERQAVQVAPEGLVHLEGAFGQIRGFEGELAQRHAPRALLETAPALEETAELAMELAVRQLPAAQPLVWKELMHPEEHGHCRRVTRDISTGRATCGAIVSTPCGAIVSTPCGALGVLRKTRTWTGRCHVMGGSGQLSAQRPDAGNPASEAVSAVHERRAERTSLTPPAGRALGTAPSSSSSSVASSVAAAALSAATALSRAWSLRSVWLPVNASAASATAAAAAVAVAPAAEGAAEGAADAGARGSGGSGGGKGDAAAEPERGARDSASPGSARDSASPGSARDGASPDSARDSAIAPMGAGAIASGSAWSSGALATALVTP